MNPFEAFAPRTVAWVGVAFVAASCTSTRVETEHYLAVFDPQEQVTQELYRVKIRGHSKPLSNVDYASGWVPAADADLLTRDLRLDDEGKVGVSGEARALSVQPSRQFYEVGPLAVATQPLDGRFVIVMANDPDHFFRKVATLSRFRAEQAGVDGAGRTELLERIQAERIRALSELDALAAAEDGGDESVVVRGGGSR